MRLTLVGEANDYVGKGLSGGMIVLRPVGPGTTASDQHTIMGNVVLYGATGGHLFAAGSAGERFAIRNSGAFAVVEGVGDHGCEYMTGGTVVVLGQTGINFGAGMTGGAAYVLDCTGDFPVRVNPGHVTSLPCPPEDYEVLEWLVSQHLTETDSSRAQELLADWNSARKSFWKVAPKESRSPTPDEKAFTAQGTTSTALA
jgi:glutamate synthase domain-containing protein 3